MNVPYTDDTYLIFLPRMAIGIITMESGMQDQVLLLIMVAKVIVILPMEIRT